MIAILNNLIYFPHINSFFRVILVQLWGDIYIYMDIMKLAPHEAIEVHELISQEILGTKKVSASIDMVIDVELKSYMKAILSSKKLL